MIFLGSDHRGYHLKNKILLWLSDWGFDFLDLGNKKFDADDDYVDFAANVARQVSLHEKESVGIVVCGSGVGVDIVANKFNKIRAALGFSPKQIAMARVDDDVNILALPADFISYKKAKKIVGNFLKTEFDNRENHLRRIKNILKIEEERK